MDISLMQKEPQHRRKKPKVTEQEAPIRSSSLSTRVCCATLPVGGENKDGEGTGMLVPGVGADA